MVGGQARFGVFGHRMLPGRTLPGPLALRINKACLSPSPGRDAAPMHAHNPGRTPDTERVRPPASQTAASALVAQRPAGLGAMPAASILALQRSAGNAAVSRMLEQSRHRHGPGCSHPQAGHPQAAPVQRSAVRGVLAGGGQPLAGSLKEEMEMRLGADFSDVRLHTGAAARASAAEVGARAYTSGNHVVIGDGGVDKHTLAHELTHVIQQRSGPVDGTLDADGLKISDPGDRFERAAEANARTVMSRPVPEPAPAVLPAAESAAPVAYAADGGTPVARMMSYPGRQMNPYDVGRHFEIRYGSSTIIGVYRGPSPTGGHVFDTTTYGRVTVRAEAVVGVRARVGGMHPPGQMRRPEENLRDRDQVYLSEADMSGAAARLRRDPALADRMAVTTYEGQPNYSGYAQNSDDLRRLGVPILNNVDIRNPQTAERFSQLPQGANLHFQMPRVPRNVAGYSTPQLIRDTAQVPGQLGRDDMTVSITAPHPDTYGTPATHNRLYGLESGNALRDTDMEVEESHTDSDENLEQYGYQHRQSTQDTGAGVAHHRKKYRLRKREDEE
jgi:Domain of unknown function (DUF4157)